MEAKVDCSKEKLIACFEYKPKQVVNITCIPYLAGLEAFYLVESSSYELEELVTSFHQSVSQLSAYDTNLWLFEMKSSGENGSEFLK